MKPEPVPVAVTASSRDDDDGTRPLAPGKQPKAPKDDPLDALLGATIDGRYRIKARLGQGGVGAVYQGEHVETKRPSRSRCCTRSSPAPTSSTGASSARRRRRRSSTHPSCVSVIDFGRVERVEPMAAGARLLGIPYLVMEFVRGESLADRIARPRDADARRW